MWLKRNKWWYHQDMFYLITSSSNRMRLKYTKGFIIICYFPQRRHVDHLSRISKRSAPWSISSLRGLQTVNAILKYLNLTVISQNTYQLHQALGRQSFPSSAFPPHDGSHRKLPKIFIFRWTSCPLLDPLIGSGYDETFTAPTLQPSKMIKKKNNKLKLNTTEQNVSLWLAL